MLRALIVSIALLFITPAFAQSGGTSMFPPATTSQPQAGPSTAGPVTVTIPNTDHSILGWVFAGLSTLATGLLGKIAFKPAGSSPAAPGLQLPDPLHIDPNIRAQIDAVLLQLINTGAPGQVVQSGLGLIPGIGPFAPMIEGFIRKAVAEALAAKAAPAAPSPPAS